MIGKNVSADFSSIVSEPVIDDTSYVHPLASVIGSVIMGKHIMVSPMASIGCISTAPLSFMMIPLSV